MSDEREEELTTDTKADTVVEEEVFDASEYVQGLIARMGGEDGTPPISAVSTVTQPSAATSASPASSGSSSSDADSSGATGLSTAGLLNKSVETTLTVEQQDSANADAANEPDPKPAPKSTTFDEDRPSRATPELLADLESLREAANLTTTSALNTFDRKSLILRCYSSLGMAIVSIILALILLSLNDSRFTTAHYASMLMFTFAAIATWRYMTSTSTLTSTKGSE